MSFPRTFRDVVLCCQHLVISFGVTVTTVVRSGKLVWLGLVLILGNLRGSCRIPTRRVLVGVQVRLCLQYRSHFWATGGWAIRMAYLWSLDDIIITNASGQL